MAESLPRERRNRAQDRIPTNHGVTIVSGRRGEVVNADTVNLGPGGMFVATETPFGVGDRFICRIDLGERYTPVLSGGEVRWVDDRTGQQGMGVRFLDIAEVANSISGELLPKGKDTVRVRVEAVGPALEAAVVRRAPEELVIDMALPFLAQGRTVEVGSDIAARTATVSKIEWMGEKGEPQVRLSLELAPSPSHLVAEQVARSRNGGQNGAEKKASDRDEKGGRGQDVMVTSWQRPVTSLPARRKTESHSDEHEDSPSPVTAEESSVTAEEQTPPVRPLMSKRRRVLTHVSRAGRVTLAGLGGMLLAFVAATKKASLWIARHPRSVAAKGKLIALRETAIAMRVATAAKQCVRVTRALLQRIARLPLYRRCISLAAKAAGTVGPARRWVREAVSRLRNRFLTASATVLAAARRVGPALIQAARKAVSLKTAVGKAVAKALERASPATPRARRRRRRQHGRALPSNGRVAAVGQARLRTVLLVTVLLLGASGLVALGYGLLTPESEGTPQEGAVAPEVTPAGSAALQGSSWHEPDPGASPSNPTAWELGV